MSENTCLQNFSRALIIQDQKIFLLRKINKTGNWFQLPGAPQKFRETLKDSLLQFFNEEVGERIDIRELRFVREYIGVNHEYAKRDTDLHFVDHIYICHFRSGSPDAAKLQELNKKGFGWVNMSMMDKIQFIPKDMLILLHPDGSVSGDFYLGDTA